MMYCALLRENLTYAFLKNVIVILRNTTDSILLAGNNLNQYLFRLLFVYQQTISIKQLCYSYFSVHLILRSFKVQS